MTLKRSGLATEASRTVVLRGTSIRVQNRHGKRRNFKALPDGDTWPGAPARQ